MPSQPEDEDQQSYREKLVRSMLEQKLLPRNQAMVIHEGLEEQVYVIGQLIGKLEHLGLSRHLIGVLRNNHFDMNHLPADISARDLKLLAKRDVDETIYRIESALNTIDAIASLNHASDKELDKDKKRIAKLEAADKSRAEYIQQRRQGREKEEKER